MKVSIITATYNSSSTVLDCIQSVNNQTYADIEHIIIDGVSTDNTLERINSIPNKAQKTVSEPDKGIYDAMNKGIGMAQGDIIGILNSDDFLASNNIIATIVKTFERENCDAVFGNLDFVSISNVSKVVRRWKSTPYKLNGFLKGWHPPHPTLYVKRDLYEKYGNFDISLAVSADFELMLRFIEKYRIKTYYLDETIVKMRYGGESTGSIKKIITGNINIRKAFHKNGIQVPPFYTVQRILTKVKQFFHR